MSEMNEANDEEVIIKPKIEHGEVLEVKPDPVVASVDKKEDSEELKENQPNRRRQNSVTSNGSEKRGKVGNKQRGEIGGKLFIGNLETERVTYDEFQNIWSAYGNVVEVAMHKGYGFVSFADKPSMEKALEGEQGRLIGSRRIDLQVAKNQRDRTRDRGQDRSRQMNRRDNRGGRDFNRNGPMQNRNSNFNRSKRDRSPRPMNRFQDRRGPKRQHMGEVIPPHDGNVVKIILLGEQQRVMAEDIAHLIGDLGVPLAIEMLDGRTLSQAIRDSEANMTRYVLIIGKDNMLKRKITLKFLHVRDGGKSPTFDLDSRGIVYEIESEERRLGFLSGPPPINGGFHGGPPSSFGGRPDPRSVSAFRTPIPVAAPLMKPEDPVALSQIQLQLQSLQQQLAGITQAGAVQSLPIPNQSMSQPTIQDQIFQQQKLLQEQLQQLGASTTSQPVVQRRDESRYPQEPYPHQPPSTRPKANNISASELNDLSRLLNTISEHRSKK